MKQHPRLDPDLAAAVWGEFRQSIESSGPLGRELFEFFCAELKDRYAGQRLGLDFTSGDVCGMLSETWADFRGRPNLAAMTAFANDTREPDGSTDGVERSRSLPRFGARLKSIAGWISPV